MYSEDKSRAYDEYRGHEKMVKFIKILLNTFTVNAINVLRSP
jgi:hypothetical protein